MARPEPTFGGLHQIQVDQLKFQKYHHCHLKNTLITVFNKVLIVYLLAYVNKISAEHYLNSRGQSKQWPRGEIWWSRTNGLLFTASLLFFHASTMTDMVLLMLPLVIAFVSLASVSQMK